MKFIIAFISAFLVFEEVYSLPFIISQNPGIDFYEEATLENFNENELEILKPFIDVLQTQYNNLQYSTRNLKTEDVSIEHQLNDLFLKFQPTFPSDDDSMFHFNSSLLNIDSLKDIPTNGLSSDEAGDIQDIFQESFDDAHLAIRNLIELSIETEKQLISINKIKIIRYIYRMMNKVYTLGIRGGRAAYCTYSSYPAINATLTEGSHNIGSCYNYTETSIGRLRRDVKTAITDIRANVKELVSIYKKIAKRQSLLGKLLTVVLNLKKITKDIKESRTAAITTINEVKTDGPIIAATIQECASTSIPNFVKQLNQTITDLTTCINFVDDSTQRPEPEPESSEESVENQ